MPWSAVIFMGTTENAQHVPASWFIKKKNENNEGLCWWPYNKHDNPPKISINFSSSQINKMIIQESVPNDYDGSYWPAKCISTFDKYFNYIIIPTIMIKINII